MTYKGVSRLLDSVFKKKCRFQTQKSSSSESPSDKPGDYSNDDNREGPAKNAGLRVPNSARDASETNIVKVSAAYQLYTEKERRGINLLLCLRCPHIPLPLAETHIKAALEKRAPQLHIAIVVDIAIGEDRDHSNAELELAMRAVDYLVDQLTDVASLHVSSCAPTSDTCAKAANIIVVDSGGRSEDKVKRCAAAAKKCLMESAAKSGGRVEKHMIIMSNNVPLIVPSDSNQWSAIMRKNRRCGILTSVIGVGRRVCISSIRKLMMMQFGMQRRQGYIDQMQNAEAIRRVAPQILFKILRISPSQLGYDLCLRFGGVRHAAITNVYGGAVTPEGIGTINISDVNSSSRRWVMMELQPTKCFKEGRGLKGVWNLDVDEPGVRMGSTGMVEAVPIDIELDPNHWKALAIRHANLSLAEDEISENLSRQEETSSEQDAESAYSSGSSSEEASSGGSASGASFDSSCDAKVDEDNKPTWQDKSKLLLSASTAASTLKNQNHSTSHSYSISL